MNILYIGDIMGEPGMRVVRQVLPGLRQERCIDFVIVQAENVSEGKGITLQDFQALRKLGVDFCTGGNHSLYRQEIVQAMNDPAQPIIRPANYPADTPGLGYKRVSTSKGDVLVVSLLGHVVGRDAEKPVDNPLHVIDAILADHAEDTAAVVINFHGDFSSEKIVIGHYLDGRAAMVVGDHWHVATADGRVLPKSTAHITDVGMCGTLDSSLGVKLEVITQRWKMGASSRNELESDGPLQFNALLADIDEATGLARSAEHIRIIV